MSSDEEQVLLEKTKNLQNSSSRVLDVSAEKVTNAEKTRVELKNEALSDQIKHRKKIVTNIIGLAWISLMAFLLVVSIHMLVRYFWKPEYQGISDGTMQIMATGIFGEVVAVMATLCIYLWKDPKD